MKENRIGKEYFVELESLRGIAAILVAVLHASHWFLFKGFSWFENLKYFVDFFFVLSGFVIIYNFNDSVRDWSSFRLYLIKRFFRLYPLFAVASIPFVFVAILKTYWGVNGFNAISRFDGSDFLFYSTLLYKWGFVEGTPFNYPSWSISVELLLYVVSGVTFVLISGKQNRVYLYVSLAIISMLFLTSMHNTLGEIGRYVAFRGLLSFSIGALVYYLFSSKGAIRTSDTFSKAVIFLLSIVFAAFIMFYAKRFPYLSYVFPLLWALVIYFVITKQYPAIITGILRLKAVKEVGKVSYSFYLLHAFIISLIERLFHRSSLEGNMLICILGLLVYLGVTYILASITYRFVELPGKDLYNFWTRVPAFRLGAAAKQ